MVICMRTFSEVNRDIRNCKIKQETAKNNKEYLKYSALLYDLEEEKEEIWNTLFNGHKNIVI